MQIWGVFHSFRFIAVFEGGVAGATGVTAMRSARTPEDTAAAAGASQTFRDMAPSSAVGKARSPTTQELHPTSPCQDHPPTAFQGGAGVRVRGLSS